MEHEIRYCTTDDGVHIAYSIQGSGPPVIKCEAAPASHLALLGETIPETAEYIDRVAQSHTYITFDPRGCGLSDRTVQGFSLDARLRDVTAVHDHANVGPAAIAGIGAGAATAMAYAARYPTRVSHLSLESAYTSFREVGQTEEGRTLGGLVRMSWDVATETMGSLAFGWGREMSHRYGEFFRQCVSQETALAWWLAELNIDVSGDLSKIEAPTLIVRQPYPKYITEDMTRRIAAAIPKSRLLVIDLPMSPEYWQRQSKAFLEFLGDAQEAERAPQPSAFRTVIFTDLVGHTEMMSRLGDERGRTVLREHETITRNVLKQYGGTEVKTMGDGFMAWFGSVTKAVECAIALQRAFAEREGEPLAVRVGLNAGEPIEEDGDLFGATVILASRIAAKAGADEILVADTVRGLCSGKGFLFADRGEFVAKGIEEPVRISEVRWHAP
jgi:class 3 adenylate cyclase/pimeloyl-ACP methyl ester carboxylesterase